MTAHGRVILLVCIAAACGTNPIAPDQVRRSFSLTPTLTGLRIGDVEQFAVSETLANGTVRVAQASWTTDNSAVLVVDDKGTVTALTAGAATIRAVVSETEVTKTLEVVRDATGRWSGQLRFAACSRESGTGPDVCIVGPTAAMSLTLTQTHNRIEGTMDAIPTNPRTGRLEGTIRPDASIVLNGTIANSEKTDVITDWQTKITDAGLVGRFKIREQFTNAFGPQILIIEFDLVNVRVE